jgi:hypothetical protein
MIMQKHDTTGGSANGQPRPVPDDEAITLPDLSRVFDDDGEPDPLDPDAVSDREPPHTNEDEEETN